MGQTNDVGEVEDVLDENVATLREAEKATGRRSFSSRLAAIAEIIRPMDISTLRRGRFNKLNKSDSAG